MNSASLLRKMLPFVLLLTFVSGTMAQPVNDSLPLYQQFPFIPSFKLLKTDSSTFLMDKAVPQKKAAVVILFSPTCNHCWLQTREIINNIAALKDITFLFATTYSLQDLKGFSNIFSLNRYANIKAGQDRSGNLLHFYRLKGLPGIYVYNKNGALVQEFNTNVPAARLLEAVLQ